MAKFDIDGVQNVEVSIKLPCEKSPERQLEIMEEYTRTHRAMQGLPARSGRWPAWRCCILKCSAA